MTHPLSRREFLAAAGAGLLATRLRAATTRPPNIVFILGEGMGWTSTSVQMDDRLPASRGSQVRTPALERLAARGMRFSDGYAPSPRCTPSRAGLLTGLSPAQLHMTFINEEGAEERGAATRGTTRLLPPTSSMELPRDATTTGSLLRAAGYATAHFGKWHVGEVDPRQHGFDEADGANANRGPEHVEHPNPAQVDAITDLGLDFLQRQATAGRPFFLNLCHYGGRKEADVKPASYAAALQRGVDGREAGGIAAAEEMDASIGRVLDRLQELGVADNTYVIYTADHGSPGRNPPLKGGKGTVWEGGIRVPLLIAGPGIAAGVCSHVRVTGLDLLPTFAEWAGRAGAVPAEVEGGSLVPLLRNGGTGEVRRPREEFVAHFPAYDKDPEGPASALLLGAHKLVRHDEKADSPALFDLSTDLFEQHDLAAAQPALVQELTQRLDHYLETVGAQRVTRNPDYDPNHPTAADGRKPKGGGRPR